MILSVNNLWIFQQSCSLKSNKSFIYNICFTFTSFEQIIETVIIFETGITSNQITDWRGMLKCWL